MLSFFLGIHVEKFSCFPQLFGFLYKELICTGYQIFHLLSTFLYLENCSLQYYGINQGA
jgi:hypothetical protein